MGARAAAAPDVGARRRATRSRPAAPCCARSAAGRRYEVFLVWDDHRLAVLVAKLLRPELASDPAALRELADEGEALARLAHPVLVRGFDVVAGGRFPHLLIEHLEGPTLRELIDRDGAAAARAAAPARPARRLGAALHGRRGDGAPRRQARQRRDGSAAAADRPQRRAHGGGRARGCAGRSAPTATWRPSSATRARGPVGPPADVFGLAATLHHAVSGVRPFARDGRAALPAARARRRPRSRAACPPRSPPAARRARPRARRCGRRPPSWRPALEPLVAGLPKRLVLGRRGWRRR